MRIFSVLKAFIFSTIVAFSVPALAQSVDEAIGALAEKLGAQLSEEGTERLAIYGFSDLKGFESALGDFISEELTTAIFGAGDFTIVERNAFERVLKEHELYASDIFNSDTIAELGEFLAIQALITGSITQFDQSVRVNARAIDVATARVFAAASVTMQRGDMVNALLKQRSRSESTQLAAVPGAIPQTGDIAFENEYFRIVHSSVRLSPEKNSLRITAEIQNLTNDDLLLKFVSSDHNLFATTEHGDTLDVYRSGLGYDDFVRSNNDKIEHYTSIQPGSAATMVLVLAEREQRPIVGNTAMVQGTIARWGGSKTTVDLMQFRLDGISVE